MKFNKTKTNSMSCPWVESDFARSILNNKKINKDVKRKALFYINNGYVIFRNALSLNIINNTVKDFYKILNSNYYKKNPEYFHYNKHPRIVEGWKKSKNIKIVAKNKKIEKFLNFLYDKKPLPISTINFLSGTEQPLHSDYIHFGSVPERYLAGVWYAFEDVGINNGPLTVVPMSHKLKTINFSDLNLPTPRTTQELKKNYTVYENYLAELIKEKKLKKKKIYLKKGDAIIWAANLLHGGNKIKRKKATRLSQVVHYHFDKLNYIYNPCFTNIYSGIISKRNLKELIIK